MPDLDDVRLALYRANGFGNVCVFCFGRWDDEDGVLTPTPMQPPASYPRDLATIIAAFVRPEDGMARTCVTCREALGRLGDPNRMAEFIMNRIRESPWFQREPEAAKEGITGMVSIVQYAWWTSNGHPKAPPPPGLRFTIEVVRTYPMLPPLSGEMKGPNEVLTRDVGLGCYVSVAPLGLDVFFIDFASRRKHRGNGAIAFRQLLALADRCGAGIIGVVQAHGAYGGRKNALSSAQLLRWYERFGFAVIADHNGLPMVRREPRS